MYLKSRVQTEVGNLRYGPPKMAQTKIGDSETVIFHAICLCLVAAEQRGNAFVLA